MCQKLVCTLFRLYHSHLQTAVLGVFYILAMGRGLSFAGTTINLYGGGDMFPDELQSYQLLFAGSFLTSLFWVSSCLVELYIFIYMYTHRQWCRQCGHGMPLDWKVTKNWQKIDRYINLSYFQLKNAPIFTFHNRSLSLVKIINL